MRQVMSWAVLYQRVCGGGGGVYVLYQCEGAYVYTFDTNYVLGTIVLLFHFGSSLRARRRRRRGGGGNTTRHPLALERKQMNQWTNRQTLTLRFSEFLSSSRWVLINSRGASTPV